MPDDLSPPAVGAIGPLTRDSAGDRWRPRPDAVAKVVGQGGYLTDMNPPGTLVGRILRAAHPHARILSVDTAAAEALPGVAAIVTAKDVPGLNGYGIVFQDQPALCGDKVRYLGDAVAAVAAETPEIAAAALKLIRVAYEPLPVVDDMAAALEVGAPAVHADGNLCHRTYHATGDVGEAMTAAAVTVSRTYVTPRQMHGFMETEGGIVTPEPDGRLTVRVAGQHGRRDRLQLARILNRSEESIRVISSPSGGAFGGKDELTVQPAACLLALKTGRPVRIHLGREESLIAGWKRHPMRIEMTTGADKDGRLVAHRVRILADTGAYASLGPAVLLTATENSVGPYRIDAVELQGFLAYTNNPVAGAFRGFGANQATFALECQMDALAHRLGMDPLAFRRLNLRAKDSRGAFGQTVVACDGAADTAAAVAANPRWQARGETSARRDPDDRYRWGTGIGLSMQGNGLGSLIDDPGGGRLRLTPGGRIEAAFSFEEYGQNVIGAVEQLTLDRLGIAAGDVAIQLADTDLAPDTGSTTAGRTTVIAVQAMARMAEPFKAAVAAAAAPILGLPAEALTLGPGGVHRAGQNEAAPALSFVDLAASLPETALPSVECAFDFPKGPDATVNCRFVFAFSAAVAVVRVDSWTGQVRVDALDHACAAGPVVSPMGYLGQIDGAALQALGFTLMEDVPAPGGTPSVRNFDGYLMPTLADTPATMETVAIETLEQDDPIGPRGVGEIGMGAAAPAIVNAILNATGVQPAALPVDPAALLAALDRPGSEGEVWS